MALNDLERFDKVRDGWLLDTNVISAILGNQPTPDGIGRFFATIDDKRLWLSVITIGEIRKGIERLPPSESGSFRSALQHKLSLLQQRWARRILPIDLSVAERWGTLLGHYQDLGQELPAIDALIAATADVHNLVVVSHDKIFSRIHHVLHYDPYLADVH